MVAIARPLPTTQLPYPPTAQGRRLVIVRSTPTPRRRAGAVPAATYRRRRRMLAMAVATLLLVLSLAVRALVGGAVPDSVTVAPRPQETAGAVYVVQAGDTFWDIARVVHPAGDPRPVVARLVAAHGGAGLEIGERIPLRDRT